MADATEEGTPKAGGQLSGAVTRAAVIKRQQALQKNPAKNLTPYNPKYKHPKVGMPPGLSTVPHS